MKIALIALLLLVPFAANSGGLLGDAVRDLGMISSSKAVSAAVSKDVDRAAAKIERAALVQTLQEDALTKRIVELENTVKKQQEILARYEKIVAELQAKLGSDKK